ncbi:MAG: RNA methyltransferase [Thiobacillus sp.]|nr:RNA methyltransferase [Thiobacillus sp.]
MAYDEGVAARLRELFLERPGLTEKKMFGGLAFMYRGHMLVGIIGESLMARIGQAEYEVVLKWPHVREMDFTGKPMKGYVYVDPAGFESDSELGKWANLCIRINASLPPK